MPALNSSSVATQSQTTKFLREDGTWAAPSYTSNAGTVTKVNNTSPDSNGNVSITIPTKSSWNYDDTYVKYSASQSLTDAQKSQARTNIGAGTSNFTGYTSSNKLDSAYITNNAGWTTNTGTVIGSSLTSDQIVLGNSGVNIKISSYKPSSSSTTWDSTSDVYLPTMKSIKNYVTGLGYITSSALSSYVTTNTAQTISGAKTFTSTINADGSSVNLGANTFEFKDLYLKGKIYTAYGTDGTNQKEYTLPSSSGTLATTNDLPSGELHTALQLMLKLLML